MGLTTRSSSALLLKSPTGFNRNLIQAGTRRFSSPLHSSAQSPELLKENNFLLLEGGWGYAALLSVPDPSLRALCTPPASQGAAQHTPQPPRSSPRAWPRVPAQEARRCCCSWWHHTAPRATFFFWSPYLLNMLPRYLILWLLFDMKQAGHQSFPETSLGCVEQTTAVESCLLHCAGSNSDTCSSK